jgi:hypothetical protein
MTLDEKNRFLRNLSPEDFLDLGDQHVAYVREIDFMGKPHFALVAADGQPITIASTRELVTEMIGRTDFELVTLH